MAQHNPAPLLENVDRVWAVICAKKKSNALEGILISYTESDHRYLYTQNTTPKKKY